MENDKMTENKKWINEIKVENARMLYKHFSGEKDDFHNPGQTDFSVIIEDLDYARELEIEGWNIKYPKPNPDIDPEEDRRRPTLKVNVVFDNIPPKVWIINVDDEGNERPKQITAETLYLLDTLRFTNIDMIITPYKWTKNGRSGISAYLSQFYGTVEPRGFEGKYGF